MPAKRVEGYDHPHMAYAPLHLRPPLAFDGGWAAAVTPVLLLELFEDPLPDWPQIHSLAGGLNRAYPNISRVSTREYGHRIGIYKLVNAMQDRGLAPTVAIDAMTAEQYPSLVTWLADRGTTWVAHGISVTRPITGGMGERAERSYIDEALTRLVAAGVSAAGWLGAEYGESARTPTLLAEAGVRYVLDWSADEQPIQMTTPTGSLHAYPVFADLDDQTALANRMTDPWAYGSHLAQAVQRLAVDGRTNARAMAVCLRPWLIGQPFRLGIFEDWLDAIRTTDGAWVTDPVSAMNTLRRRS